MATKWKTLTTNCRRFPEVVQTPIKNAIAKNYINDNINLERKNNSESR